MDREYILRQIHLIQRQCEINAKRSEVDENGKCHYLVSKEEMEELSKRLMERIQKGVNQCNFESI